MLYQVVDTATGDICSAFQTFEDARQEALTLHASIGSVFSVQRGDESLWDSRNGLSNAY